jgi:pseudouridine-5'-phosphate glycosidase
LQIHKRKREADELRKILIKKEKVELQKQLLVLIPMVRRFNLIAREMKRLIEGKISIEYRNFSHY